MAAIGRRPRCAPCDPSPGPAALVLKVTDATAEPPVTEEPRLTTVMGVARAVMATVGPRVAARVLVDEFGWDATLHALALLRGDDAAAAFGAVWESLLTTPVADELEPIVDRAVSAATDGADLEGPRGTVH